MTQPAADSRSMFAIFRKRDFSLMWSAQLISTIGEALTDLAAAILIFRITGSAFAVGAVLMVTAIPTLVFGLFAGVFVDRFDKKRILLLSNLLRGFIVLGIPLAFQVLDEAAAVVALYGLVFVSATVRQFFDPAWEAVLPEIASEEELTQANSFLAVSSFGSTAVGFAAAGFLASANIFLPFYIDAATYFVAFALLLGVRVPKAGPAEPTSVAVVVDNLKSGASYLWNTPILRSIFIVGAPTFLSFGLWNVLLLPMAIRELDGTEFEYGLQEGLTSVGFVIGSFLMARFGDRLNEGTWLVVSTAAMGVFGVLYGLAPTMNIAIVLVMITGFLNSPMSIARRLLLQRHIPRDMRGRVFSAFFVSRDVLFLVGMAGAGLADVFPVRELVIVSSLVLLAAGVLTQVMPGLGRPAAEWRRTLQLLRTTPSAPTVGAGRPANMLDLDRLIDVLPELKALAMARRNEFLDGATVATAPPGFVIVRAGDASDAAFFVLGGKVVAGIPAEGEEFRSLSSMGPGDFFGEIAALTGSPRTANVVADESADLLEVPAGTLKSLMEVPEMSSLISSKLRERLTRTQNADLIRLAGLDQRDLRDLRRRRPTSQALPKTYSEAGAG
ncbi:MAG TPA: MFS transporter [Candidatus Limnocylindrales bacterium]|nr:MFS transporter [Candidatus Limnocylindrales bacterium]